MKRLSKASLGYLAGIIDGEGCIALNYKSATIPGASCVRQLVVGNTDKRLVDWLHQNLGGYVRLRVYELPHKNSYIWQASASDMVEILEKVLPHLLLKREQANIVIQYSKTIRPSGCSISSRISRLRHKLVKRMSILNRKGRAHGQD